VASSCASTWLLQHSRRDARLVDGRLVLLPDQERWRWHADEIAEALEVLRPHVTAPGTPYLVQGLIAAEHAIAPHPDATDWPRIVERYDELVTLADSPVVRLNRAVAVSEADGPLAGLRALEGIELPGHRLPGVRGELLARVGRTAEARAELARAVELCDNDPERAHLAARLAALEG
jgi:predicted RNA polymerase sigma factor